MDAVWNIGNQILGVGLGCVRLLSLSEATPDTVSPRLTDHPLLMDFLVVAKTQNS